MRAKQPMPSDPGAPPAAGATARPDLAPLAPLAPLALLAADADGAPSPRLDQPAAPAAPPGSRRSYQPPRILFREPLEAMAAICTPHPPAKANKGLCPMGPISS